MTNLFVTPEKVGEGVDEHGDFEIIPISMVRGGQGKNTKVYKKPLRHILNDSAPTPRGWYKSKHEPARVRPRPCYTETWLTTPYGGFCHVGCKFCYVDHGTRGYRATGLATANPNYPEQMKSCLDKMQICGAAYISSFTEPFQELENAYHITERLSKYVIESGLPLFYLSRKDPPAWAKDALLTNSYNYMQWSVCTSNQDTLRKLSPGALSLDRMLKRTQEYSAAGIYTSFQCNPILPGIVSLEELEILIALLAQAGGRHIIFKFAEQVSGNKKILFDRLESSGAAGVEKFEQLFTQFIGGVYTVNEQFRKNWLSHLLGVTRKHNMTMSTCYEYYDNDRAGANMAPWFTTSDQCHGRGVPMFYRNGAKFKPLPGCYRKGCLYCAEYGTRVCGNNLLLQAQALSYKEFRETRLVPNESNWSLPESCPKPGGNSPAHNLELQTDAELWGLSCPW